MSTVYTGNSANVTTPLAATLNGATNASPIVCSTTANHLFGTGDTVAITGAVGNTAANGTWTIIVLSPTTFSLTGSTGNGAWSSGGACVDQSLTPQFTIPSDGDTRSAASVNVGLQMLADRTQYLASRSARMDEILTSGTWTCPAGVTAVIVEGCGGGGAGGGGSVGSTLNANSATGGGGGGGSQRGSQLVAVVAGTVYTTTIGAGGSAPAASTVGPDGGNTTFGSLATFAGAGGGCSTGSSGNGNACAAFGGTPVALSAAVKASFYYGRQIFVSAPPSIGVVIQTAPGSGGASVNQAGIFALFNSPDGTPSTTGFAGGVAAAFGGTNTGVGGGSGGGGGGGAYGPGGASGAGGNGFNGGPALPGSTGVAAAANSGAGGGGGGGGGSSTAGGGSGGTGGSGGSGRLRVFYYSAAKAVIT